MTIRTQTETDILRFVVEMGFVRNDEERVKQVIEEELSGLPEGLHAAYLKVALRVVVAQFYGLTARRLDHELGYDFVDTGLGLQELANDGLLEQEPDAPDRPALAIVRNPGS